MSVSRTHKVVKKIPEDVLPAPQAQAVIASLGSKGEEVTHEELVKRVQKKVDSGEIKGNAERIVSLYIYRLRQGEFVKTTRIKAEKPKAEKKTKTAKEAKPAAAKTPKVAADAATKEPKTKKTVTTIAA